MTLHLLSLEASRVSSCTTDMIWMLIDCLSTAAPLPSIPLSQCLLGLRVMTLYVPTENEFVVQMMHDCTAAEYSHLAWVNCCTADKHCFINCGRRVFAAVTSTLLCMTVKMQPGSDKPFCVVADRFATHKQVNVPCQFAPLPEKQRGVAKDKVNVQLTCIA